MSFQGYQGEVNPQAWDEIHFIPGAEEGAQMMQLTQVQLAQIVSSTVNHALTQHAQQTASNPPLQLQQVPLKYNRYNNPSSSMYPYLRVTVQQVG